VDGVTKILATSNSKRMQTWKIWPASYKVVSGFGGCCGITIACSVAARTNALFVPFASHNTLPVAFPVGDWHTHPPLMKHMPINSFLVT
jgi:hypothetical protein